MKSYIVELNQHEDVAQIMSQIVANNAVIVGTHEVLPFSRVMIPDEDVENVRAIDGVINVYEESKMKVPHL